LSKVPYKASKAWHLSHTLAIDVYQLAVRLYQLGQIDLASGIHESSKSVPHHIADAHKKGNENTKEQHLHEAREALTELNSHLAFLQELRHIDEQTRSEFSRRAEEVYHVLGELMVNPQLVPEPSVAAIETTEESNGIIDNRSQERDAVSVGRATVSRDRLQSESNGARRINRQRSYQEPARRQSPRENIQG
jgi:four helix bundle protein